MISLNTRTCCKVHVHIHQVHSSKIILYFATLKNNWTTITSEPPEDISIVMSSSTHMKNKYAIVENTVMIMHLLD